MQVREVMTRDAECTRPDANLQEVAGRMKDLDVGSMPVCDNDRLVGMVTDRDIAVRAVAEKRDPSNTRVRDIMTPGITTCFEDEDVESAAQIMKQKQVRRLAVLNKDKRFVGMLSLGDLAVEAKDDRLSARTLEKVSEPARPSR